MAPEHSLDVAALLHKADAALYAAKQSGKGQVRFYRKNVEHAGGQLGGIAAAGI